MGIRDKQRIAEQIREIVEYGREDDTVELLKAWKVNATPQEVQEVIILFRDAKREFGL